MKWKHKDYQTTKKLTMVGKKEVYTDVEEDCCEIKDLCCKCYAKYFVRRKLDYKTSNHSKFDSFCLEPQKQAEEHR